MRMEQQQQVYDGPVAKHPLYWTYHEIRKRCERRHHRDYRNYGARGIKMHPEWRSDPRAFFQYIEEVLGAREPGMTLDRIDNDRHYEPGNLRWSTRREQTLNRSCTVWVEYQGERRRLSDLCAEHKVSFSRVFVRIKKLKWSIEDALTKPSRRYRSTL